MMIPWQLHEFPSSERCIAIQGVLASGSTLIPQLLQSVGSRYGFIHHLLLKLCNAFSCLHA
jgi:hypothetical protein